MSLINKTHGMMKVAAMAAPKSAKRYLSAVLPAAVLLSTSLLAAAQSPLLPSPVQTVSTVPADGDLNPYGVSFVPKGFASQGLLHSGDLLVSNFNNSANLQGTGSTIIHIGSNNKQTLFFQGKGAEFGLTTGLNVLSSGYVMVGNVPTADGTCATVKPGSLIFLNSNGKEIANLTNETLIDEPWDATVIDHGDFFTVFISNAATGEISRLHFAVTSLGVKFESGSIIASGYSHTCGSNFIIAETGLAYNQSTDTLYVASTGDNAIYAVQHADTTTSDEGRGTVIYEDAKHLHGPNGLILAPNGHLIAGNSDFVNPDPNQPSEYVEFTTEGQFVKELSIDPNFGGSFGLGVAEYANSISFAAVDDNANAITIWSLPVDLNP